MGEGDANFKIDRKNNEKKVAILKTCGMRKKFIYINRKRFKN